MQFPSDIVLIRIGLRRCVTRVFELHAVPALVPEPTRAPQPGLRLAGSAFVLVTGCAAPDL